MASTRGLILSPLRREAAANRRATRCGGWRRPVEEASSNGVRGEPQSLPRGMLACGGSFRVGAVNTAPDSWPGRRKRAASRQGL